MRVIKILFVVLALLGMMACASAEELPSADVAIAAMETGEAGGWRIPEVSGYQPGTLLLHTDGTPYLAINETDSGALMVLQKGERNVLCLMERDGRGQWRLEAQNTDMLYQGADAPIPYIYCEIVDQLELYFHHWSGADTYGEYVFLTRGMDGWRVTTYCDERAGLDVYLNKNLMTFTDERYRPSYTVRADFSSRFESFGLERIRQAAQRALSLLPEDASAPREGYVLPDQVEGTFAKNQKFDVYAAPGADSYRAAKGKASVSTNGGIEIYGETRGWLMVQYEVSRNQRRIGYITADALPMDTPVRALDFAYQPARMIHSAVLTDDPFWSRSELKKLAEGEDVILLAKIADWVYVEATMPDGRVVRGFIPESAVTTNLANG